MKRPITLGGHFGHGIEVFPSGGGIHHTLQYGFVRDDNTIDPEFQITEIGKEDMIKLATLLLTLVVER